MKKKRLALGLLLSVVLVAALNGAYLKRLPINVMLEVSGKGFIANSIPVYSYRLSLTRQPLFVSYNKLLTISTVISADVHLSVSDNCLFLCRLVLCQIGRAHV